MKDLPPKYWAEHVGLWWLRRKNGSRGSKNGQVSGPALSKSHQTDERTGETEGQDDVFLPKNESSQELPGRNWPERREVERTRRRRGEWESERYKGW